jgi:hypothetical protein
MVLRRLVSCGDKVTAKLRAVDELDGMLTDGTTSSAE